MGLCVLGDRSDSTRRTGAVAGSRSVSYPLRSCGGVPKWPKGSDCKSDGNAFTGSNPVAATID